MEILLSGNILLQSLWSRSTTIKTSVMVAIFSFHAVRTQKKVLWLRIDLYEKEKLAYHNLTNKKDNIKSTHSVKNYGCFRLLFSCSFLF